MRRKLIVLILAAAASTGMFAWDYEKILIGNLYYNLDALNRTAEVTSKTYGNYSGSITIPATVTYNANTYDVTGIGDNAFEGCTGLTSIVIPDGITDIGYAAFADCSGLTSVTIPESVATLGLGANFQRCTGLRSVRWNAVSCVLSENSLGNHYPPFKDLNNLTDFTFGDKVRVIPESLCMGMTGLTSVTIPEGVTSLGTGGTFQHCTNLRTVQWNAIRCTINENEKGDGNYYPPFHNLDNIKNFTFGEKVEAISASLCFGLSGLTAITIPESVTEIGRIAFRQCTGLTSVRIPSGVTDIGVRTFADCTGLTAITSEALVPPTLGEDAFLNVNRSIPLYVHCPSAKAYKAANQWKEFESGCEPLSATIAQDCSLNGINQSAPHPLPDTEYTLTLMAEECGTPNRYVCFDGQDVTITAVAKDGYLFKQWNDGNTDNPRSIAINGNTTLTALFMREGCDLFEAVLTVPEICADEDSLFIPIRYTDNEPATYTLTFNADAAAQGFRPSYTGDIRILSAGTAQIAIPLPTPATDGHTYVRPNVYQTNIEITDECDNVLAFKGQSLTIHYPSDLIFQRWNDVLSLSNEDYNGHYQFASIRWFHEGTLLTSRGDNDAYICVSPDSLVFGDAYWAELTRTDDGVTMTTCPFYPVRMNDRIELGDIIEPYVTVTPQALRQGDRTVTVKTNICGTYFVYRSDGVLLYRQPFCPPQDETFTIDLAPYYAGTGMYIITFRGVEGTSITVKVLVEQ